ncbi:hypothetical protein QWZ10_01350 [Paracoccus cavernae]|uniref:Uncharacterized protein n=1 Tax=Paracoccus cavernae TaxID=1571207 RepID=A0ABT8D4G3_9RHOB|nr:hypothetical protein [Paracoccus cavernae]
MPQRLPRSQSGRRAAASTRRFHKADIAKTRPMTPTTSSTDLSLTKLEVAQPSRIRESPPASA